MGPIGALGECVRSRVPVAQVPSLAWPVLQPARVLPEGPSRRGRVPSGMPHVPSSLNQHPALPRSICRRRRCFPRSRSGVGFPRAVVSTGLSDLRLPRPTLPPASQVLPRIPCRGGNPRSVDDWPLASFRPETVGVGPKRTPAAPFWAPRCRVSGTPRLVPPCRSASAGSSWSFPVAAAADVALGNSVGAIESLAAAAGDFLPRHCFRAGRAVTAAPALRT